MLDTLATFNKQRLVFHSCSHSSCKVAETMRIGDDIEIVQYLLDAYQFKSASISVEF